VVAWYLEKQKEFPTLEPVGEAIQPVSNSFYVGFVRHDNTGLREQLDKAIKEGLEDGTIKSIYERYDLWDRDQERLAEAGRNWPPPGSSPDLSIAFAVRLLGKAALWTIFLAFASMPLAMLLGIFLAIGRVYGPRWISYLVNLYVEIVRGTPLLLQLTVVYYFLPSAIGLRLDPILAGIVTLALNYAASEAENYRAGLLSVPRGQLEAALALGMTPWTAVGRVVVPQAVRTVVPPVTNDFIALFKDTSICSVIAVAELTFEYRTLMINNPRMAAQLGLITAALYLAMSYPLSLLARRLERKHQAVQA
jgi:polar amino acid transport system substrate-binding protein